RGAKAVEGGLGDEVVPDSKWADAVAARAHELASRSDRPRDAKGIALTPLARRSNGDAIAYAHVSLDIDRDRGLATLTARAPAGSAPASVAAAHQQGAAVWPLPLR